jgi:hypothetical protein
VDRGRFPNLADFQLVRPGIAKQWGEVYFPRIKLEEITLLVKIEGQTHENSIAIEIIGLNGNSSKAAKIRIGLEEADASHLPIGHIVNARVLQIGGEA